MALLLASSLASGVILVVHRETGHLALWRVSETESREAFAGPPPADAVTPASERVSAPGDLDRARSVALRVMSLCPRPSSGKRVRWTSVEDMIRQARAGAIADCWPRAILFESFAASAGLDARVWALEGDGFTGEAHTVPEVYVSASRRWVMIDPTLNAIARDRGGVPLGVLDLRDRLLAGDPAIEYEPIDPRAEHLAPATYYRAHVRYSFLRRHALLDAHDRFGALAPIAAWLDGWPERPKKAVSAAFGASGDVLYFHDRHNASLRSRSLLARMVLGAFLVSVAGVLVSAIVLFASRGRTKVARSEGP